MKEHEGRDFLRAALLLAVAACGNTLLVQAQTLTTIWSFTGTNGDGEYPYPYGHLVFDSNGAMYGTTASGGAGNSGTVFQLIPPTVSGGAWTENILFSFTGGNDGRQPSTGVVFGPDGALYGTTYNGGGTLQYCGGGCGVVFRLAPPAVPGGAWTQSVIYAFQGVYDGQNPGAVIFGANGALYGVTPAGGLPAFSCKRIGCGTVFQLTPKKNGSWTKTILYTFPGTSTDGRSPNPDLVFDNQGNLYGTTAAGGTSNYYGTVFQLAPAKSGNTWTETVLHNFTGGSDGGYPIGGVAVGSNGALYGTASYSGNANDSGTAFQLTSPAVTGGAWTYTVLHTFVGGSNGATPASTLTFDTNGNLYGTTNNGGSSACNLGCGTVFKLAAPSGGGGWTETILHDWPNSGQTNSSIVVFHNGLLYGTTTYLGASDVGSAFTLVP
jgi:uncharacterized repeat protein (TIGR03803 family)